LTSFTEDAMIEAKLKDAEGHLEKLVEEAAAGEEVVLILSSPPIYAPGPSSERSCA
jgi:hypothetical protein